MKALYALAAACVIAAGSAAPALAAATTDLGVAASTGDTGRLKQLLGSGTKIDTRDGEGYTALMWAALNGQVNAVSTLVTLGANLNVQDREGYTALMWATQNKHQTIVRQLLNAGANVNLRDSHGYTALHWAAQDGQLAIAQMLLQRGADPNARDIEGYTPLMWAAQQGNRALVYELLSHGANTGFRDRRGYTAYDLANAYYHPDIRKMLKNWRGAPANYAYHAPHRPMVPVMPGVARPAHVHAPHVMHAPVPVTSGVTVVGSVNYAPAAIQNPHRFHNHHTIRVAPPVNVKSGVKPRLVAVVTTPDGPYGAAGHPYAAHGYVPPTIKTAWWGTAVEARLAKYDVDRNRIIDGNDWRNLTMTTSRIALAQMLHDSRCGRRNCQHHHMDLIMNKLDWVYNDANRHGLTLNQAWDLPSYHFQQIRW